ncbi:MAG: hypothetical protein ACI9XR_001498 [Flavobacterium sp.]|jgi:uncharacterized protein (TIGR03643 family)
MKKSKRVELNYEETERLIAMAQEERKPFEAIKAEFNVLETEVTEIMKKKLSKDKFELWKKKAIASKPKPKPTVVDDFDEDLEGKYYIKNKFD